jgi:uncharacterized membrane protein (DUF106 family)
VIDLLTRLVVWLNTLANALGRLLLAPIGVLPGWLSATLVSAITGVLLLVVFKYTSKQRAIKRVKDDIKANLLALKLFKESASVALLAQASILRAALKLLVLALVPMLVMVVPVLLILGQLSLWYQARPLGVSEDAIVTLKLGDVESSRPDVRLEPTDAVEVLVGPVRVRSEHEVCWKIQARQPGHHRLVFTTGNQSGDKDLVIGDRFTRVSSLRPAQNLIDVVLYPAEKPFNRDSPIQSVAIDYPTRSSWTSGTDLWVVYWFAVSMVSGFAFRGVLNVNM